MILDEFLIKLGVVSDTNKLHDFKSGLTAITKTATALVATVGGLTAGVTTFFGSALSGLDDLNKIAQSTDTRLTYIQKLGYAASVSGSSIDAANSSIQVLAKTIGDAASGIGRGERAFKQFGLSARNADGSVRSVEALLSDVNHLMQRMSKSEQLSLLNSLGIDQSMISLLGSTQLEIGALFEEAEALGLITAQGADAAVQYNDAMTQMGAVMNAVRTHIAIGLAPQLIKLMTAMKGWLVSNKELIQKGISQLVYWLLSLGKAILNFISAINHIVVSTLGWKSTLLGLIAVLAYVKRATLVAFSVNPIVWIMAAIAGLILLIDDLFIFVKGGQSVFDWSWALPILEKFTPLLEKLGYAFRKLFDVIGTLGAKVFADLQMWWSYYGDIVFAGLMHLIDAFSYFVSFISNIISALIALLSGNWQDFFFYLNESIKDINKLFESVFKAILENIIAFLGLLGIDIEGIINQFKDAGTAIKDAWLGVMDSLTGAWKSAFSTIMSGVDKVKGALNWVGNKLGIVQTEELTAAINAIEHTATMPANSTIARSIAAAANTKNEYNNNAQIDTTIHITGNDPLRIGKEVEAILNRQHQIASYNHLSPLKL
ncbi:hypothetical protein SAMN02583745_01585 [Thorsellia anophelis DSM 18579]|uniref:Phage-related protein n=2 Tax=Thorsellia anophelis TaxID=336804 RepID=A0A1I0CCS8_9GAMM|nr:hypothetical protein SAMN02583745_01585 [Thorsellia anophelis DSM 18579]